MSYQRILKTTLIMGGSSVCNTLLGIVRTKVLALLLGPSGIGLAGIYTTVTGLLSTACGMGIGESGVRQIAGAVGTGDHRLVARTVLTVRRAAVLSGGAGALLLLIFSGALSDLTFGNPGRSRDLALLSLTILFGAVSSGQAALIQGMRQIGNLAKLGIIGSLMGTVFSIPIVYAFGERGIPYYLLCVSAASILASWWYAHRIDTAKVTASWMESLREARPLLKLGVALMSGALMIAGTQYLLRVFIVRMLGLDAAGIYQASTTLSLVYVGMILNAMLADFYPRLAEASGDEECSLLVNKQIEVGLLLAVPGIAAIMTLAPYVIAAFYSTSFLPAVQVLRWQILGVMLQLVSWPMGFILRAKGNGKLFFLTELFANGTHLALALVGILLFGVSGLGAAYFAMNLSYLVLIFLIVRGYYSFAFSGESLRLFFFACIVLGGAFLVPLFLTRGAALSVNVVATLAASCYSIMVLLTRAREEMAPGLLMKIKSCSFFRRLREDSPPTGVCHAQSERYHTDLQQGELCNEGYRQRAGAGFPGFRDHRGGRRLGRRHPSGAP